MEDFEIRIFINKNCLDFGYQTNFVEFVIKISVN